MISIQRTTVVSLLLLMLSFVIASQVANAQAGKRETCYKYDYTEVEFACAGEPGFETGVYESKDRESCIVEMGKDAKIRAACHGTYSDQVHADDASQITRNNKHVVMAYAALWGIVVVFVVGLWIRQRKLSSQILILEAELKKAAAE